MNRDMPVQPEGRVPIPPGKVSTIRGRYQGPALHWITQITTALAAVAIVARSLDESTGDALGWVAVGMIMATPILRVLWLIRRWRQEHDRRFILTGLALLLVIAAGAVLAALGVGG